MNADQPSPPIALPVHLNWRYLALVAAGGIVGTALRELLTNAVPRIGYVPVSILGINLLGAFLLGGLVETLVRRGPDYGWRRALRLLLGTGVLGTSGLGAQQTQAVPVRAAQQKSTTVPATAAPPNKKAAAVAAAAKASTVTAANAASTVGVAR